MVPSLFQMGTYPHGAFPGARGLRLAACGCCTRMAGTESSSRGGEGGDSCFPLAVAVVAETDWMVTVTLEGMCVWLCSL